MLQAMCLSSLPQLSDRCCSCPALRYSLLLGHHHRRSCSPPHPAGLHRGCPVQRPQQGAAAGGAGQRAAGGRPIRLCAGGRLAGVGGCQPPCLAADYLQALRACLPACLPASQQCSGPTASLPWPPGGPPVPPLHRCLTWCTCWRRCTRRMWGTSSRGCRPATWRWRPLRSSAWSARWVGRAWGASHRAAGRLGGRAGCAVAGVGASCLGLCQLVMCIKSQKTQPRHVACLTPVLWCCLPAECAEP